MNDDVAAKAYHDNSRQFRDALLHTASVTGFSERLIEKDYYCSILLKDLCNLFGQGLVFKGGTCLSKVHLEFFRLSEDLDFGISVKPDASRAQCRRAVEPIKAHLDGIVTRNPIFTEKMKLKGSNLNKHYAGEFIYQSCLTSNNESIKVEFSLREEVLLPCEQLAAKTMLLDPITGIFVLAPFVVSALSLQEACAEKTRAALTRHPPAIRDFFDLDHAFQKGVLQHDLPAFLNLVSQKLAVTEDSVNTSTERIEALARQLETQLKTVLRPGDYANFVLARVVDHLNRIVEGCRRK
jgi:predicted nucleotidyltransferase component of viral defense system